MTALQKIGIIEKKTTA